MRLLLDEMYPPALAAGLDTAGIDTVTVADLRLTGHSDDDVFAAAIVGGYAVLTENVGDFTRIAAAYIANGDHHHGLLIALSSRFSRRPNGIRALAAAIERVAHQQLEDRVIFLGRAD